MESAFLKQTVIEVRNCAVGTGVVSIATFGVYWVGRLINYFFPGLGVGSLDNGMWILCFLIGLITVICTGAIILGCTTFGGVITKWYSKTYGYEFRKKMAAEVAKRFNDSFRPPRS